MMTAVCACLGTIHIHSLEFHSTPPPFRPTNDAAVTAWITSLLQHGYDSSQKYTQLANLHRTSSSASVFRPPHRHQQPARLPRKKMRGQLLADEDTESRGKPWRPTEAIDKTSKHPGRRDFCQPFDKPCHHQATLQG